MPNNADLTEEQLDFVKEMMGIGAGNAARAFSQILNSEVEVSIPNIIFDYPEKIFKSFENPSQPIIAIKMNLVGDVIGNIFYILPLENKNDLIQMIERAAPGKKVEENISALTELASIISGVYLTAIHDFTDLNIFHSVTQIAEDMLQSILDEFISVLVQKDKRILMIENEFSIAKKRMKSYLFVLPSPSSLLTLLDTINKAQAKLEQ